MKLNVVGAWAVHFYTACGLVLAGGMVYLLREATPAAFHRVFLLMFLAMIIDSTDGLLARRLKVKERVPGFDGRRLDDITDFLTYTFIPLWLIWRAELLAPHAAWWLFLPLLASAYGFCQSEIKTADGYFLGFPSYWNAVAFYLYYFRPSGSIVLAALIAFSVLTFVPLRYPYPNMPGRINRWTNAMAYAWGGIVLAALIGPASERRWLIAVSFLFPIFYLTASWVISFRRRGRVSS